MRDISFCEIFLKYFSIKLKKVAVCSRRFAIDNKTDNMSVS